MTLSEALANVKEGLVVRPGDTLVIHLPSDMTAERFDQLVEQLVGICDYLPERVNVMYIHGANRLAVIRAGDEQ